MTKVYFIRHAEPNYKNHDDASRELTEKGMRDRGLVTRFLKDKQIHHVFSSPYKRAMDTVRDFADRHHLPIEAIDDFRERRVDSGWIEDFAAFCKNQWNDFTYRYTDGESLLEVQQRNIAALERLLVAHPDENLVIGSHGTALSTIINHYDPAFGYNEFERIKTLMPWIVEFTFHGLRCVSIRQIDVFNTGMTDS